LEPQVDLIDTRQYSFGAGPDRQKESVKYLEKAYHLGIEDAAYTLGLVHLILGDKHKSLEYFEAYVRSNPDDESAKRLIERITSGKVEVKRR
jgi:hypothetical protein